MDVSEVIRNTAILGYVIGATLVAVAVVVLVVLATVSRRDDGFRSIGEADPPPVYVSPFARPRAADETHVIPRVTGREER